MADAVHAGQIQSGSSHVPVTLAQMAELQLWRLVRRLLLSPGHRCPLAWEGGEWDVSIVCPRGMATAWGVAALSYCSGHSAASTGEGNCRGRAGADRCEHLREEQDVKPQERLWVGPLLLHAVMGVCGTGRDGRGGGWWDLWA